MTPAPDPDGAPLRIAFVAACPFPARRGTPIRIERMAEALVARGHHVTVFTYPLSNGSADPRIDVRRTRPVRTFRRTEAGPSLQKLLIVDPLLTVTTWRGLRRDHFDLVHAHHVEGLLAARAARPGPRPLVFDAHTLLESELPHFGRDPFRGAARRIGRALDRTLPALADHTVAVTDELARRLGEFGYGADRVTVIENGVDEVFLQSRAAPSHGSGIVFAGGLGPYQRIDLLLQSFAEVRRRIPGARLTLAVEDPAGWREHAALCDRLALADAVDVRATSFGELPAVLAAHAVAVNPRTAAAGMPVKLLNYLASGVPIVSFAGSAHGLVDGVTALVVPDGATAAFADAVVRLLRDRDLALRLGAAARATAEERTWRGLGERLETLYRRLLRTRARSSS